MGLADFKTDFLVWDNFWGPLVPTIKGYLICSSLDLDECIFILAC